jgi:hypothetical protein
LTPPSLRALSLRGESVELAHYPKKRGLMDYHFFNQYKRLKYLRACQERIIEKIDEYLQEMDREIEVYEKRRGR